MLLDDCPVPIFGDVTYRGKCHLESVEQASFFNRLRAEYPDTYGALALHPRNEGFGGLRDGQFSQVQKHKAEGLTVGASDIIIPGAPSLVCEMKRMDPTKSQWQPGQREYLAAAHAAGSFACIALGAKGAWEAFETWLKEIRNAT